MSRILVTGSEGFIGTQTVKRLTASGHEVFTLDRRGSSNPEKHFKCDLGRDLPDDAFRRFKPEVVVHLAAQIDVTSSFSDPRADLVSNGLGTLMLVEASQKLGGINFIYIGSGGAIYDSNAKPPLSEASPVFPVSPYGLTKYLGEGYVRVLSEKFETPWTSLALSNCYGPVKDHGRGVIYQFWKALREGRSPHINGPDVTRDFVYIDDVIAAIELAIKKPTYARVNISSNSEISLLNLFKVIAIELQSKIEPTIGAPIVGEVLRSCLGNQSAKELLGWSPNISLQEGIKLALEGGK
jgi:UDP-glucose 4-epimerase